MSGRDRPRSLDAAGRPVAGTGPAPADPAALASAWAARVRANREQVERLREVPDPPDFYGPVSGIFRADPRRTDEPLLADLLALARPGETWLDIGAGAGRYALPLALRVREVVAVEPSAGMAGALREEMAAHAIANVRVVEGGWPPGAPTTGAALEPGSVPPADVALIAHLGYDIEAIEPFLAALEAAARRRCVAVLMERQPSSVADPFWPPVHGEERVALPGYRDLVELLRSRGRSPEVVLHRAAPRAWRVRDEAVAFLRRQLWIAEGGAKDRTFLAALGRALVEGPDGWSLEGAPERVVALLDWAPAGR